MSAIHPHVPFRAAHRTLVVALAVGLVLLAAAVTTAVLLLTGDTEPAIGDVDVPATTQHVDLGGPIDSCYGAAPGSAC